MPFNQERPQPHTEQIKKEGKKTTISAHFFYNKEKQSNPPIVTTLEIRHPTSRDTLWILTLHFYPDHQPSWLQTLILHLLNNALNPDEISLRINRSEIELALPFLKHNIALTPDQSDLQVSLTKKMGGHHQHIY